MVVLVIGLFALAVALTVTGQMVAEIVKGTNTISGDRSFHTAEAASREAIYQHINYGFEGTDNFSVPVNEIQETDISFEIAPSVLGWAYREIEGDARNISYRKVKNTLLLYPSALAFDHAIYSEGNLTIRGNISIIGNVFSNDSVSCVGNAHNVDGNASAVGSIGNNCNTNSSSPGSESIPPPFIDPWYYDDPSIKTCESDAANVISDCLSGPTTGVIFINDPGNTAVLNGIALTGTITVIGNLQLGGNSEITALSDPESDPTAVVVHGNLSILGDTEIHGLIYVTGSTTFAGGSPEIYCSIISVGGMGNVAGTPRIEHVPLLGSPGGFDTTIDPRIINWQEE